jgi:hypothetical protein
MGYQPGKRSIWFKVLLLLIITAVFCWILYYVLDVVFSNGSKTTLENNKLEPTCTSPWHRISFPITITEPLNGELSMYIRFHDVAPEITMVQALKYNDTQTSNLVLHSSDKIKYCKCEEVLEETK